MERRPYGRRLATASADKTACVWAAGRGRLAAAATLWGHADGVTAVAWRRGGDMLATASRDLTARVWLAGSGAQAAALRRRGGRGVAARRRAAGDGWRRRGGAAVGRGDVGAPC